MMRAYFDAGDYFDRLSSRNARRLNREIDKDLADDSKWRAPNWKARHRWQYLVGFLIGFIIGIVVVLFVLKILGF
jgi:hypothetical protein